METVIKMNLKGHGMQRMGHPAESGIDRQTHIAVLKEEIRVYQSRIQPSGTGYLYDAIAQLKRRIEELSITQSERVANYVDESSLH